MAYSLYAVGQGRDDRVKVGREAVNETEDVVKHGYDLRRLSESMNAFADFFARAFAVSESSHP